MAIQHGGDLYDFGDMTDDEIRSVVIEHLRDNPTIDSDWIDVLVRGGHVTLTGQVGTDGEVQVAEEIVHDVLGIEDYQNDLIVDEFHRGTLPEAVDEAISEVDELEDQGDIHDQQSDTADHLVDNLEDETYGTHDMDASIRDGTTYVPPDSPRPGGYESRENH